MAMTMEEIAGAINASGIGLDELPVVLGSGALLVREARKEDELRRAMDERNAKLLEIETVYAEQIKPFKDAFEREVGELNAGIDKLRAELAAIQEMRKQAS